MGNIGHIYITGQIGNTYDKNQQIESKGVELLDVVEQVANLEEGVENIHVHINSPGGFVTVGDAIAEFLSSLKNQTVYTIAEEQCASIATKIHLSVPVENRYIQSNCSYMIHNPFVQNVSGDADDLIKMGKETKEVEEELEAMYAKSTGLDKVALSGLMKITTGLTPEQCVTFGFASKIINLAPVVAMIYNEKDNQKNKIMNNSIKDRMLALIGKAPAKAANMAHANCVMAIAHPVNSTRNSTLALTLETDQGAIETPFMDVMVGDPAMMDGEPAADGTYALTVGGIDVLGETEQAGEGTKIVVKGGFIDSIEIEGGEPPVEDNVDALKAALATANASNTALTAQNAKLTGDLAQSNANAETVLAELTAKGITTSTFTPPIENSFTPKVPAKGLSMKEQMAAAKAKYAKK